jgi:hypothetical protein
MAESTYLYQSVPVFLTLIPNIPIRFTAIPQHIICPIQCLGYTALLKTLQSLLVRYVAIPLWYTVLLESSSWGKTIVPSQEPHTLYSCFMLSLNGLFTTTSSICSYEVIPPGMTTMSVFMELPVIVALFLVLNVPWMHPRPASPNFSGAPLAFCYTPPTSPSEVHCFSKTEAGYFSLLPSPSYVCFQNSELPCCIGFMFCQHTYHHLFKFGIATPHPPVLFITQVTPVALFCMWPGILVD